MVSLLLVGSALAEPFGQAKVTRAEGSVIRGKSGVQTGPESKAELDWLDGTIARVGANARFSYTPGTRETVLDSGTLLLSSPKEAGGFTVRAGGTVTSAAGAGDLEVANIGGNVKVICLSGKPTVYLAINPKARDGLRPGQMLSIEKGALKLSRADTVNLKVLLTTSTLMKMGPLSSEATLRRNAGHQGGGKLPTDLPGGANNEIAVARTTQLAEAQQVAARQLQQQQVAAEQAAAQQLARQQLAAQQAAQAQQEAIVADQQRAAIAASGAAATSGASGPNAGGGPQGNNANPNPGNPNNGNPNNGNQGQGKPPNVPPGQVKKQ